MKVSSGDSLAALAATIEAEQAGASGGVTPASAAIVASSGPAIPTWVRPEQLAEAQQQDDEKLAALQAHFEEPPEKPTDYQMLPPLPGQEPLSGEQIRTLRTSAHAAGLSAGEFRILQAVLQKPEPEVPHPVRMKQGDKMGADLTQRYGEARAKQMADYAVLAIDSATGLDPGIAGALRVKIAVNRPLLELLSRIGERHAKRKTAY